MAHWIKPKPEGIIHYGRGYVECSECNGKVYIPKGYRFCPFCGEQIENIIQEKDINWKKVVEELPAE